jgi:hypothetical protein
LGNDLDSLFLKNGQGYTGKIDDISPHAQSTNGTNSAAFRLTSKRADFQNVAVYFDLYPQRFSSTPSTPPVD